MELHLRRRQKQAEPETRRLPEEGKEPLARRRLRRAQQRLERFGPKEARRGREGGERRGLRRLLPRRRTSAAGAREEEGRSEEGRSMAQRGRDAIASLRERVPSGEQIRAGANDARVWASNQLEEHAVALGVSALTAGVIAAALLPTSSGERRVVALGRQLRPLAGTARQRITQAGATPQAPSAPSERPSRKEARTRGKPQRREAAAAPSEERGERPQGARRSQRARKPTRGASLRRTSASSRTRSS